MPRHRRFVSDSAERMAFYIQAAQDYVARLSPDDQAWLYRKPYDCSTGHPAFFDEMYALMNLLRVMGITPRGHILEVGSGPGWVTEILVALGYSVDALEPSETMIAVAGERLEAARNHFHLQGAPQVRFYAEPIETCGCPTDQYDAVLFHAALHHVVDEVQGLKQCFRVLRPGGVLGVSEGAWVPGDKYWEEKNNEAMRLYGALENPFTAEYLDYVLKQTGFVDIRRYYMVNGLFPANMGDRLVSEVASYSPVNGNNLVARKPSPYAATTRDPNAHTEARIEILASTLDRSAGTATIRVRLLNRGETTWLAADHSGFGWVSIALRRGELGSADLVEGEARHRLARTVEPGQAIEQDLAFRLPPGTYEGPWLLDLVNEEIFWFSTRGTEAARVHF